jgi:tRNA(Ile)-lysidine synthase
MLQEIEKSLRQLGVTNDDTLLVAVSGGSDSMVLLHALRHLGVKIAVAHYNYGFRGNESDLDEQLVRSVAEQFGVKCHVQGFIDSKICPKPSQSMQMMARSLRYDFFNDLMDKHGYIATAMAHHADDRIESLLINLLRGTGIKGMQGMPVRSERFIRPMLSVRKAEITSFAQEHGVAFRDDSSNFKPKYLRNRIRLHLLPMLRQMKPETDDLLQQFTERVAKVLPDLETWSEKTREQLTRTEDNCLLIDRNALREVPSPFTALHSILQPLDFSSAQTLQLISPDLPGKGKLKSKTHVLYIEPEVLRAVTKDELDSFPGLSIVTRKRKKMEVLDMGPRTIVIDGDLFDLDTLNIRNWEKGDRFHPLGMKGQKKISDFLIDKGLSRYEKDRLWVMTSRKEIVWVIGHRMDDRFKVTDSTTKVTVISICDDLSFE